MSKELDPLIFWTACHLGDKQRVEKLASKYKPKEVVKLKTSREGFEGETGLHAASRRGHIEVCRYLVKHDSDPNAASENNDRPIHLAALSTNPSIIALLVLRGAEVDVKGSDDETALRKAIRRHKSEAVRELVYGGALAKIACRGTFKDDDFRAGLIDRENLEAMIEAGTNVKANLDAISKKLNMPLLHLIAYIGSDQVLSHLLKEGVDIHATDKVGQTALRVAIRERHRNTVGLLIRAGATFKDACRSSYRNQEFLEGFHHVADAIISVRMNDKDLHRANVVGVLHVASLKGDERIAEIAVSKTQEVIDAPDDVGMTPLHVAAWVGRAGLVEKLLAMGAAVDPRDQEGQTPLRVAIRKRHDRIIKELLKKGASFADACDSEYKDAGGRGFKDGLTKKETIEAVIAAISNKETNSDETWSDDMEALKEALPDMAEVLEDDYEKRRASVAVSSTRRRTTVFSIQFRRQSKNASSEHEDHEAEHEEAPVAEAPVAEAPA